MLVVGLVEVTTGTLTELGFEKPIAGRQLHSHRLHPGERLSQELAGAAGGVPIRPARADARQTTDGLAPGTFST